MRANCTEQKFPAAIRETAKRLPFMMQTIFSSKIRIHIAQKELHREGQCIDVVAHFHRSSAGAGCSAGTVRFDRSIGRSWHSNTLQTDLTYIPPTQSTKFHNYVFDAFGPYPSQPRLSRPA